MTSRRSTSNYKRFKFFTEKSDFEAPYQFMCDLPPVPIEPKLVNFSIPLEMAIKYKPLCLEMNQERNLFADVAGGINIDLINSKVYEMSLPLQKIGELTDQDLELSQLVLSTDASKSSKNNPRLNLAKSNSTKDIISKLNLKKDKEKSRYNNLDNEAVSMYLRHTTILTTGNSKVYGQNFSDPIATVEDYAGDQYFESGENLSSDQYKRLGKLITKSFDKIHEIDEGMVKPGTDGKVTAKSVKAVYPYFEFLNKPTYLCQFYDNPQKDLIKDEKPVCDLNAKGILLKDKSPDELKFYSIDTKDKSALGKRKRGDDSIELYPFEKRAMYRTTSIDESIQQSAFLFYGTEKNKLSYLSIDNRVMLVRKKEAQKKTKMFIPGLGDLNDQDDDYDNEYKERVKVFGFPKDIIDVKNLPQATNADDDMDKALIKKASMGGQMDDEDQDNEENIDDLFDESDHGNKNPPQESEDKGGSNQGSDDDDLF